MKTYLSIFYFLLFSSFIGAQKMDSLTVARELDSLIKQSNLESQKGNYKESLVFAKAAYEKSKSALGEVSTQFAGASHVLASCYNSLNQYDSAEVHFVKALEIWEKIYGNQHLNYGRSLNNLGMVYCNTGQFKKAESALSGAREIFAKTLGTKHVFYTNAIYNLGRVYFGMGLYKKAEQFLVEARNIRKELFGKNSASYGYCLMQLGLVYHSQGFYDKSESNHIECLEIFEKTIGKKHPDYAAVLMNFANLSWKIGRYQRAEQLYRESLDIAAEKFGTQNSQYGRVVYNMANLYHVTGQYMKADSCYLVSLQLFEKTLGKKHPSYLTLLKDYGLLKLEMAQFDQAEKIFLKASDLQERFLGTETKNFALLEIFRARSFQEMGQLDIAADLSRQGLERYGRIAGKENYDYIQYLIGDGDIAEVMKRYDRMESAFTEAILLQQNILANASTYLTLEELQQFDQRFQGNEDALGSVCYRNHANLPSLLRLYSNYVLSHHCFLLDNSLTLNKLLREAPDSIQVLLEQWRDRQVLLAGNYARQDGIGHEIERLEEESRILEKRILQQLPSIAAARQFVTWTDVQKQLKAGETAIEFVQFRYHNNKLESTDSVFICALLIRPDEAHPRFIPLFEKKELESLLNRHTERGAGFANYLYAPVAQMPSEKSLYEMIWQPLEKALTGVKTVFFSPVGLLHRLNLNAVAIPRTTEKLSDRYRLISLGSTRQLVAAPSTIVAATAASPNATVIGGIRYDMDSTAIRKANETILQKRGLEDLPFNQADSSRSNPEWKFLPWTAVEALSVAEILKANGIQVQNRQGYAATEAFFKSLGLPGGEPSPRILHVATHGYFFPDPRQQLPLKQAPPTRDEPVYKVSKHPMIRSGLILAGANQVWITGKSFDDVEDGVLTAYEISQLDLSNTELVVLSACETGLGDIDGNEGVYGLQRAFKIAGAKYLIMSLWQVPDYATQELMTLFYALWLEDKMTIPDAFHAAQKQLRKKFPQPSDWAGFVLVE